METVNSIELISGSNSNNWSVQNLGAASGKWSKDSTNGSIVQTGVLPDAWGSILLLNTGTTEFDTMGAHMKYAPIGQVGLTFKFKDKSNFALLLFEGIDDRRCKARLVTRNKGTYKTELETEVSVNEPELLVVIAQLSNGVSIQLGDKELFTWPVTTGVGGKIGLYCNQFEAAGFFNVSIGLLREMSAEVVQETLEVKGTDTGRDKVPVEKKVKELDAHLSIGSPRSETQVEFSEVFTVPLDNFYVSLYRNYGEKKLRPDTIPPLVKPQSLAKEGSRVFSYDLSAEKLLVVAAKGWQRRDRFELPIQSVYSAIVDKQTMTPLEEYETAAFEDAVTGVLPTGSTKLDFRYRHETVHHDLDTNEKTQRKPYTFVRYAPSGSFWIAADHYRNSLVIINNGADVGRLEISEELHTATIELLRCFISPDEKVVIGLFHRKSLRNDCLIFWSVESGRVLKELMISQDATVQIDFSANSDHLIVWCGKYRALLDGRTLHVKQVFPEHISTFFFTHDSQFVVGHWHNNRTEFWNANTGAYHFYLYTDSTVTSVNALDTSRVLVTYGSKFEIIDLATQNRQTIQVPGSAAYVAGCGTHPTDNEFFVYAGNRIYFFDSATLIEKSNIEVVQIENPRYSKNGKLIVPNGPAHSRFNYLDITSKRCVQIGQQIGHYLSWQQDSAGKTVLIKADESVAYLYDLERCAIMKEWKIKPNSSISLSPSGREVIEDTDSVDLSWTDINTKQSYPVFNSLAAGFGAETYGLPMEISPDGNLLLFYHKNGIPTLWDVRQKKSKPLLEMESCIQGPGAFQFSPGSDRLLAITEKSYRHAIELNLVSGSIQETPNVSREDLDCSVRACCYDATGTSFYTFHSDGLWNWRTQGPLVCEEMKVLFTRDHWVEYMGISPRGDRMFLLCSHYIALINLVTNKEEQIIEIVNQQSPIGPLIFFSPDSSAIVIPNGKELVVHDLDPLKQPQQDNVPSTFSYLLDYRPKRWYRTLKSSQDQETHYSILASNFEQTIRSLRMSIFSPPQPVAQENETPVSQYIKINDGLLEIAAYQKKYEESIQLANKALDVQQAVSGDLRMNGYNLVFRDKENPSSVYTLVNGRKKYFSGQLVIEEELTNKGYGFAIIGGKPKVKKFTPFQMDADFDYSDNDLWREFWGEFKASMLNQDTLSPDKKQKFQMQADQLQSLVSNAKLQAQLETIEREIVAAKDASQKLDQQIKLMQAEIDLWTADKTLLDSIDLSSYDAFYTYIKNRKTRFVKLGARLTTTTASWGDSVVRKFKVHLFLWKYLWITETHARANYRYTTTFQPGNKAKPEFSSVRHRGDCAYEAYDYLSQESPSGFVERLRLECADNISDLAVLLHRLNADSNKIENEILFHNAAIADIAENSLAEERKKFVTFWNDANQFGAVDTIENQVMPEADPLSDLLVSLQYDDNDVDLATQGGPIPLQQLKWKTDYFKFSGDQFYNEEGLTLRSYLEFLKGSKSKRVAIFPKMEDDGTLNSDAYVAVVNPQPSLHMDDDLPVIKFVESYRITIRWTGYSLGELSHTENLFPNESKEIKITRSFKMTRRQEQSQSMSETRTQKTSSSFEENLQKEVSLKDTSTIEKEDSTKTDTKVTTANETESSNTETKDLNLDVQFPDFIPGVTGGLESKTRKESTNKNSKKDTFEKSLSQNTRTANKESREAFSKENLGTIRKAASETSQENKVEIKVSSSEEYSSSQEVGETIKLENPNMGRTINYYFFQIQNGYEVETTLTDVKIVVDMNREVIKGSTVTDIRVFDLEEVGKIFADESEDARYLLTAAIIARQVFRNYLTGVPGIGRGNGALRIKEGFLINTDALDIVNFTKRLTKTQTKAENLLTDLYEALSYLKQVPFEFRETPTDIPKEYFINAGGYYLDAEVGRKPATEKYLEDRRDIETSFKQAEVDMLKAKIEAKAFYPPAAPENGQAKVPAV